LRLFWHPANRVAQLLIDTTSGGAWVYIPVTKLGKTMATALIEASHETLVHAQMDRERRVVLLIFTCT